MRHIIVLSGPMAAGKSELARRLADQHGVRRVSTSELIKQAKPDVPNERAAMQAAGEALDRESGGKWVASALSELADGSNQANVVIDASRIGAQIDALRDVFGAIVTHECGVTNEDDTCWCFALPLALPMPPEGVVLGATAHDACM